MNIRFAIALILTAFSVGAYGSSEVINGSGTGESKGEACAAAKKDATQGCVGDGKVTGFSACEGCDTPSDNGRYTCSVDATCEHSDAGHQKKSPLY